MPIAKARKVVTVPLQNLLVPNSSPMAASTSLKGGSRKTRPARPTISQSTIQMRSEAIIGTSRPNMRISGLPTPSPRGGGPSREATGAGRRRRPCRMALPPHPARMLSHASPPSPRGEGLG